MKRSEFDLEPTKLTGVVRYVGKIDSEYVDHRYYVGVKLDEAGKSNISLDVYICSMQTLSLSY